MAECFFLCVKLGNEIIGFFFFEKAKYLVEEPEQSAGVLSLAVDERIADHREMRAVKHRISVNEKQAFSFGIFRGHEA